MGVSHSSNIDSRTHTSLETRTDPSSAASAIENEMTLSGQSKNVTEPNSQSSSQDLMIEEMPVLTQAQKEILKVSWSKLQAAMESVGVIAFLNLFETHPETLKPFLPHINTVREMEMDEWYQEKLRVHALRVMAVVEKTMHRIDCEDKAAKMLSVYGRRHHSYGVNDQMLDLMSDCFIVAIQPPLEDNWNKEVEAAWRALFKFMLHCMKNCDNEESSTNGASKIVKLDGTESILTGATSKSRSKSDRSGYAQKSRI